MTDGTAMTMGASPRGVAAPLSSLAATVEPIFELREPECVNLADTITGRDHLSHSSLGTKLACEQKFNLHYELGLRQAITPTPLALGRGFADALESGDPDVGYLTVMDAAVSERTRAAGNPWIVAPSEEETEIGAVIVREASRCYLNRYGQHEAETRELTIRVRIRNPHRDGRYSRTHDLLGRVDAVNLSTGTLIEDKLAGSMMRGSLPMRVRLDRQISIGCYLIWRATGVRVNDVRYRITLKPQIRRRKDETHDGYLTRIASDYQSRPDFYLVDPPPVERDLDDFLRLEQELWRWAEQVRDARRDGVWPRNSSACLDHGGCKYLPICSGEPGAMQQFRVSEPDPEFVDSETTEVAA